MTYKRKTSGNKMMLELDLPGPTKKLNHKINITYPDFGISIPEVVNQSIQALQDYKVDYKIAQKPIMKQTNLKTFFTFN